MNRESSFVSRWWLLFFALLTFSVAAFAQIQNGQFNGTVTDPSGASIPGATVTVTNVATDLTVTVETNDTGFFIARELPPGTYRIAVEAEGFKRATRSNIVLNAGTIQRVNVAMEVGQREETVEVTGAVPLVNTEDSRPQVTISSAQIENLPLNGRNVYDLLQQAPGAVNATTVITENGAGTIVNGVRMNFNGFTINGVSNKGLSGGFNTQPIQDTVQEFQVLTMNMSAQYGNSAGAITNLVTKGGTNELHGSAWWFVRNDVFDATEFFVKQSGAEKPPLRFNQFGATVGGPIVRDKLFFFGAYQGDRFLTVAQPTTILVESPGWRQAVISALPGSVAALLYNDFPPSVPGNPTGTTLDGHVASFWGSALAPSGYSNMFCLASVRPGVAERMAAVVGVTQAEIDQMNLAPSAGGCGGSPFAGPVTGTFARDGVLFHDSVAISQTRARDNLFHGNEASIRIDYNWSANDRLFGQYNYHKQKDELFGGQTGFRGFLNPTEFSAPNAQVSYIHTFSPRVLNEFRIGYASNYLPVIPNTPGVPSMAVFDDGVTGFGSYNGYPQIFREHIYTFADMVSITRGNHNFKIGFDGRRNMENSEFNVGRPSYYFFDSIFFAADAPYFHIGGVDPGFATGEPAQLASNIRHFRNWEFGFYFNDDWKVTRNFTLNLGLRYDLYTRHVEADNLETTFRLGPGNAIIDDITTGAGQMQSANAPLGSPECMPADPRTVVLAGVCGPGGFDTIDKLGGPGDHNNIAPKVGFAWDVFGDGRTAIRGGAGISYEGTFYNALSNSRWNPPFYSFNLAVSDFLGGTDNIVYGPQSGGAPRYTGDPDPLNFQGEGATAVGNIMGWDPNNSHAAFLTGIVLPSGIRDPYVTNWFLGLQRELMPNLILELNYVGTAGRKLFRAENINRIAGGRLPEGTCVTDNLGRQLCSQVNALNPLGRLNPNFGVLRNWQNVVNSSYNALQASLRKQMGAGWQMAAHYTWSHSIDGGSTWHSGATSANGPAAGEGYTTDQSQQGLDRGNSIFDIRHRLAVNWVWDIPAFRNAGGVAGAILGGWQWTAATSYQTGAHFSVFDSRPRSLSGDCSQAGITAGLCTNNAGDFNLDGQANDRPDAQANNVDVTREMWANGWGDQFNLNGGFFTAPCLGCVGNLGRNTFVGPDAWTVDTRIAKRFAFTERVGLQFMAEFFNLFNRPNFLLPGASGAVNNRRNSTSFGKAGGTFNPRNVQFGLRLTF